MDQIMAFVSTTNAAAALNFYEQTLGLTLVESNTYASVFDCDGIMLRVTAVETLIPQPFTVLGFRTADIRARIAELSSIGFLHYDGMGQDGLGIWTTPNGDQIAWFHDPDHNVLSLTQFSGG